MPLPAGTKLGPHEIADQLGAGGMGEVYRATDTRLDRTVAIKVLPEHLADRAGLRERFEREAKAVSSLNHPHICTLFDVGEQDGIHYLVMEYVDGETLQQRLEKGRLPLDQALEYAIQIADALDKAHRQGVVHRDLKPGNIMITKSGTKLLDFGLAKLKGDAGEVSPLSQMPTQDASAPLTAEGTILGTLQYMAPEQLEGKEADARTDIFAFGAVVYEMVTGKKAFEGASQASLIAAILEHQPQGMSELQTATPPSLDHIVSTCLHKDRDLRWQTATDLSREVKWAQVVQPVSQSAERAPQSKLPWLVAFVSGILLAAGASWLLVESEPPRPVRRFHLARPATQTLPTQTDNHVAITPDGQTLVYRGREGGVVRFYQRDLDGFDTVPIPGTEGDAMHPFFSPEGRWLAFVDGTTLMKVALAGGQPQRVSELRYNPVGGSWATDGTIFVALRNAGLVRVPAAGGEPETIATPDDGRQYWYPQVLPGTQAVLFTASVARPNAGDVMLLDDESAEPRMLVANAVAGHYVPTGHLLFVRGGGIWAIGFDLDRLEVVGDPLRIEEDVRVSSGGSIAMGMAADGTLVYIAPGPSTELSTLALVDRDDGRVEELKPPPANYMYPRVSPDGQRFLVSLRENDGDSLWIHELSGVTAPRKLEGSNSGVWAADGKRVTFAIEQADSVRNIYEAPADGSGVPVPFHSGQRRLRPYSWDGDGQFLVFTESPAAGGPDLWTFRSTDREAKPFYVAAGRQFDAVFSRNGKWIAYQTNETGAYEVWVQPFPATGSRYQITFGGGYSPLWSPDGRELFYLNSSRKLASVAVDTTAGFTYSRTPDLLPVTGTLGGVNRIRNFDITPDGQKFLILLPTESTESREPVIHIVLNFFEELKERVPVP